jgi:HK97 family phage prohead protease
MKPNQQLDGIERRDMALEFALRTSEATGAPIVDGYAAVFNSLSEVLFEWDNGRFREQVAPGAFAKTLREQNIPLLVEHAQLPLATTRAGTLRLSEDSHGLHFMSELEPTDPDVQRLIPKMRRGDLNRCSFGFVQVRQSWDDKARPRLRTLHEVKLIDVSIVARPAYPATEAKVRKALADDGLDAELITEMLVRLRQGLPLDDTDTQLMRRLVDTCQRHLPDTTVTTAELAPSARHPSNAPPTMPAAAPNVTVHPLAWYQERLSKLGV